MRYFIYKDFNYFYLIFLQLNRQRIDILINVKSSPALILTTPSTSHTVLENCKLIENAEFM